MAHVIASILRPKRLVFRLVVVTGLLVISACASLPAQDMSDARQAINAAAQSGGDQKAPEQMQQARAALAEAEVALKHMQYKLARQYAQQARAQAIEAQQAAGSR